MSQNTMYAIGIGAAATPDSLTLETVARPEPAPEEILVEIKAAGVNRGDCYQRMGLYPPPPGASPIMGLEFAGTVVACGSAVTRWQLGDRVAALVAGGGYAQFGCVHQDHALPIPDTLSFAEAASLPEVIFTVWANVFEGGGLKPEDTLLIHGGASGIGTMAIQMAKLHGSQVIITAGSDAKGAACRALGADHAINYTSEDFVERVKELTDAAGANVILDMVGGDYIQRNIACAARGGRIVNIAFLKGSRTEIDLMPVMLKNLTLTGSTLRARATAEKTRLRDCVENQIWPHIGAEIKPVIHAIYPLSEAGTAHREMEASHHTGKIILDMTSL